MFLTALLLAIGSPRIALADGDSGDDDSGDSDSENSGGGNDNKNGDYEEQDEQERPRQNEPSNRGTSIAPQKPSKYQGKVLDPDEVRAAIANGRAASLPLLLAYVNNNFPGQVLDVRLRLVDNAYVYDVKMISKFVLLKTISLEARTLKNL